MKPRSIVSRVPMLLVGSTRLFSAAARKSRSVEDEFKRLTPLEHILKCPNMYIGATSLTEKTKARFLVSSIGVNNVKIERQDLPYIPGLVKIFDEVLVNACDNVVRDPKGTTSIDVTFESPKGAFSIRNSGQGIPVKMHTSEKLYIPELVLGHLLTGSNFEKAEANATGGRHGYGAKLCNVFSTHFTVETIDSETNRCFLKSWKNNMTPDGDAVISDANGSKPFTQVTFTPDWHRFGIKKIDSGSLAMIKTRVVETAGLLGPKVKVTWNGKEVPIRSFEEFCQACNKEKDQKLFFTKPTNVLRVGIGLSTDGFSDCSFVNSMSTWRGGSHVDSIVSQISQQVIDATKKSSGSYTERDVKKHLQVFVDFKTNHPEFDSQSKDRLTSNLVGDSTIQLPDTFLKNFVKESGILDVMQATASAKVARQVNKRVSVHSIPKLEDAFKAGTSQSEECTLILTEGDSAKALAMEGISVVGRKHYGVYPLRGKLLNVRDKSMRDVAENREVLNIMNALGLKVGTSSTTGLRYGRVMFMTDQDHDGSHIKGLLLNMFDKFWPELAQKPGFLTQFITPLLKAKPRQANKQVLEFFNQASFESWTKANPNFTSEYRIKYYKGLGTSTAQEARQYFSNLDKHVVDFSFLRGQLDRELIDKVFKAERAQERKEWLKQFRIGNDGRVQQHQAIVSPAKGARKSSLTQTIENFINTDVASFSWHDVERSIPNLLDGLKPSQRKIFFALMEKSRSASEEIKVAQLAGYVAEVTAYHHGEKSLVDTIVNMAQNFVGSNNLPLLRSEGQFGTRLQGGKDAAAGRYIFTGLSPFARLLFPPEDDPLLESREEDGQKVEPRWYVPILPMVLINGCEGIGTGWSSYVPAHHPLDVADAVEALIKASLDTSLSWTEATVQLSVLEPWYKGYTGEIVLDASHRRFLCHGKMELLEGSGKTKDRVIVTELPLGMWTEDYKEKLVQHVNAGRLSDFRDDSADPSTIHFELFGDDLAKYVEEELPKFRTFLDLKNMHLFDVDGSVENFSDTRQILWRFYVKRLDMYSKRRDLIIAKLEEECSALGRDLMLTKKVASMEVSSVRLLGRSSNDFSSELTQIGFTKQEIDRFLRKPIGDFTLERVQDLRQTLDTKQAMLNEFQTSTPQSLWLKDLAKFRQTLQRDPSYVRSGDSVSSGETVKKPIKKSTSSEVGKISGSELKGEQKMVRA